jgi:hypothetical protein
VSKSKVSISWEAFSWDKLSRTWKTPQGIPHIASPKAKTFKDGAKNGIKIIIANHAINIIIVGRQPNLS